MLGAIPYQRNEAVLHTDSTLLPRRRVARAAWNFHLLREPKPLSTVTYYMNHLQRLRADRDFCVTLNRTEAIDPAKIIRTISYSHPVFTPAGVAAQSQHGTLGGFADAHALLRRLLGLGLSRGRRASAPCAPARRSGCRCETAASTRARSATGGWATVKNEFRYPLFMAYLDLDELPCVLRRHLVLVGTPAGAGLVSPLRLSRRSRRSPGRRRP